MARAARDGRPPREGRGGNSDAAAVAAAMGDEPDALPAELLARAFPDRIAQRQPGTRNVWSLSNGRGAALASESDALSEAEYLVAPSLDGGDKRSARMQLAAPLTADALRRALDVQVADEIFVVPSDGSVRRRRVERIGAIVLSSEPLPAPSAAEAAPHPGGDPAARPRYGPRQARHAGGRGDSGARGARRLASRPAARGGWPVWSEAALAGMRGVLLEQCRGQARSRRWRAKDREAARGDSTRSAPCSPRRHRRTCRRPRGGGWR